MIRIERHLSRKVIVAEGDNLVEYALSVATLAYSCGVITHISISAYDEERAGVEYHDNPIILRRQREAWLLEEAVKQ